MSVLAQAGDSSTQSPGCARRAASATAASHVCHARRGAGAGQGRFEQRRIPTEQHRSAHPLAGGRDQRGEVGAFAVAAGDEHQPAGPGR